MKYIGILFICFLLQGCSIHYRNPDTGVEHLWGFGHIKTRNIPDDYTYAIATERSSFGLNLGLGQDCYSIGLGYQRDTRVHIPDPNKPIYLNFIDGYLFDAAITPSEEGTY